MFSFLNNTPQVTKNLLLLNVLLYLVNYVSIATNNFDLTNILGIHYVGTPLFEPFQVVTHMFMHSSHSIFHILMNMLFLVMLGAHLERIWGAKRYFIFYFLAGIGGFVLDNVVHGIQIMELKKQMEAANIDITVLNNVVKNAKIVNGQYFYSAPQNVINLIETSNLAGKYINLCFTPGIGASGAVFGLMAAFGILFPNVEFLLLFPPMPVKAKYIISIYVLLELYNSFTATDQINHLAHLGGAATGAIIVLIWRKKGKNFY